MAVHYRTQGFILKQDNLKEADQLFIIYTKDFGKLKILGRAIRKIKAKLRGNSQLFSLLELEFIQGKSYKTLTDAIVINKFSEIHKDLEKLKITYQIGEVLDNLIKGEEADENIWKLLSETFDRLNDLPFIIYHLPLIYYYFFWNLVSVLGYHPQLNNCVLCGKKLEPQKLSFIPEQGGIICSNCLKDKKEVIDISPETIKVLRLILNKDWLIIRKLRRIDESNLNNLENISDNFLNFILSQIN